MGTNYYMRAKPPCECCQRPFEAKHIGKSSAGWCFSLHVYEPEDGPTSLDGWRAEWNKDGAIIEDEYGRTVNPADMEDIITKRSFRGSWSRVDLIQNHAVAGPNNLARAVIDGNRCVGHGEGTWDLHKGEFS